MKKIITGVVIISLMLSLNFVFAKEDQEENPSIAKLIELIIEGAGKSSTTPPGLWQAPGILKKLGSLDFEAPLISDIEVTNITKSSALITWYTDEDSTSFVDYGLASADYEYQATGNTQASGTMFFHSALLSDLEDDTTYYFVVKSTDSNLNQAVSSELNFKTETEIIYLQNPFDSSLEIIPNQNTPADPDCGSSNLIEFTLQDLAPSPYEGTIYTHGPYEEIQVRRIKFTASSTIPMASLSNFQLVNLDTDYVIPAVFSTSTDTIEVTLAVNGAEPDYGVMVSWHSYRLVATVNPGTDGLFQLSIIDEADIDAYDYRNNSRVATVTTLNIFPLSSPILEADCPANSSFIVKDNFNDGNADGWIAGLSYGGAPSSGNWRVESGYVTENNGGDDYKFLLDNYMASDQSVEASLLWHDNGYAGLTIWWQNDDNWVQVEYPVWGYLYVKEKWCDISPCGRDTNMTLTVYTFPPLYERKWQTLRIDADSVTGELNIYFDGSYLFTHTVGPDIRRSGLSGFVSGNAGGSFDDFILISNNNGENILWKDYTPITDLTIGKIFKTGSSTSANLNFDWQPGTVTHNCQYAYTLYDADQNEIYYSTFLYMSGGCTDTITITLPAGTGFIRVDAWTSPSGTLNGKLELIQ